VSSRFETRNFANRRAAIYGEGMNKISWLSFYDVARFTLQCVDDPSARNTTFELGGPEALSPLEVVRIFEEVFRRAFEVEFVSEEALSEQMITGNDSWVRSLAGLRRCYADGDVIDMRGLAQRFLVPQTTVRDYAVRVLTSSHAA
jgi:uncharacterized protein YbjT (DUF2867 family)